RGRRASNASPFKSFCCRVWLREQDGNCEHGEPSLRPRSGEARKNPSSLGMLFCARPSHNPFPHRCRPRERQRSLTSVGVAACRLRKNNKKIPIALQGCWLPLPRLAIASLLLLEPALWPARRAHLNPPVENAHGTARHEPQ